MPKISRPQRPHIRARNGKQFVAGRALPTIFYKGRKYILDVRLSELRDAASARSILLRGSEVELIEYALKSTRERSGRLIQLNMKDLDEQGRLQMGKSHLVTYGSFTLPKRMPDTVNGVKITVPVPNGFYASIGYGFNIDDDKKGSFDDPEDTRVYGAFLTSLSKPTRNLFLSRGWLENKDFTDRDKQKLIAKFGW